MPSSLHLHLLPSLIPVGTLKGGIAVVTDILRATTVMAQALASGASEILPCLEVDESFELASRIGPGAVLAGERKGLPIPGFHFGNSPASFTPEACRDRTVVMTTTNGTRAILAALEAERLFVGAFVNRVATIEAIRRAAEGRPIHLICAGTDGLPSLEDTLFAGSLVAAMEDFARPIDGETEIMGRLWRSLGIDEKAGEERDLALLEVISTGRGGKRVREIGLADDVRDVCRIDRLAVTAEVLREPTRIVRVS